MAIASGKTRVTITMPDNLLVQLQKEANAAKCTLSDVVVAALWHRQESVEEREDHLKAQVTYLAGKIDQIEGLISRLVDGLDAVTHKTPAPSQPKPDAPLPIATYEEMYGDALKPALPPPAPPRVIEPPRRRWRFWRPISWEWRPW